MDPRYPIIPYLEYGTSIEDAGTAIAPATITEPSASARSRHGGAATAQRTRPAATWARISAAVLDSLRDLHYVLSLGGTVQHVSPNSAALLGYGPEELLGTVLADHVHEDDAPVYRDELREASSTGRPFRFYCRIRSRVNVVGAGTNADAALFHSGFLEPDLTSSPTFSVFEITGRFHEVVTPGPIAVGIGVAVTPPGDDGLFVLMARPYPLAQGTKLDSFLSLKIENERLTAQLAALRAEQEEKDTDVYADGHDGYYQTRQYSMEASFPAAAFTTAAAMRRPSDGFPWFDATPANMTLTTGSASSSAQESVFSGSASSMFGPASSSSTNTSASIIAGPSPSFPSSSARSGGAAVAGRKPPPPLLSRTFSTTAVPGTIAATTSRSVNNATAIDNRAPPTNTPTVMEGDVGIPFIVKALTGAGFKKRAKLPVDDYVCSWCSTTSSPEWRKGPSGPKTLCNACGLRYAKSRRKSGQSSGGGGSDGGGGGDSSNGPATGPNTNGGGAASAGSTTVGPVNA
ncbi:Cutinase gene palindrome-binding protein [Lasiodiplodia hormozganensis]|uniref:Cutinase gene palindrome-binding protein n=1 Tax=Lasiodiplodia hormozganensis TaxID=869390 RepID=A0AA39Z1F1_9PEZI|nr:Cutinase gene palindrome-binding protein [Lasiodiplodia hormozganensis]